MWRGDRGMCVSQRVLPTPGHDWQALGARSSGAGQVRDLGQRDRIFHVVSWTRSHDVPGLRRSRQQGGLPNLR